MHHFVNQKEAENLGSKDFVNKLDWIVYNSNWNFEKHVYQFKIPESKSVVIRNAIEKIDFLEKKKYYVVCKNLPGHGTTVDDCNRQKFSDFYN